MENGKGRLAIIACEILKPELEKLTEGWDDVVHKDYLEFALHIDARSSRPRCRTRSTLWKDRRTRCSWDMPFVSPCPGSPTISRCRRSCWRAMIARRRARPGRIRQAEEPVRRHLVQHPRLGVAGDRRGGQELHLDALVDQGYEPKYFLDMLFENYELCVYVDTNVGDAEHYEDLSRKFAEELGLRHENRPCGTNNLARFLNRARELARTSAERAQ